MPGVFQLPVKEIADEARAAEDLGLQAVLLFGIPEEKDEQASGAYAEDGIVQKALRAIKSKCPDLVTITDVCLCEYTSHGHCGVTHIDGDHFHVLNDETVELLAKTALSHAAAGADIVMIKPALPYMDILWRVHERFGKPTAVYHVSGEYAMVKAAVDKGLLNERDAVLEIMTALKRAGANIIVTYWARELARWLRE